MNQNLSGGLFSVKGRGWSGGGGGRIMIQADGKATEVCEPGVWRGSEEFSTADTDNSR